MGSLESVARQLQLREERRRDRALGFRKDDASRREEERCFMGMATARGPMAAPALSTWISEQIARENAVAKERRKAREERQLAKPERGPLGEERG